MYSVIDKSGGLTVNSPHCAYSSLTTYNTQSPGITPPIPKNIAIGYYMVPTWNYRLPYSVFETSKDGGEGYYNVTKAYGKRAESCSPQYVQSPCCNQGQC